MACRSASRSTPTIEAEAPTIDVKQTRYDARAEIPLSGFFSQVRLRGGYAKYRHDEIEDTGEVASTFRTSGGEGRAEFVQTEQDGWGGTSGIQYFKRKVGIDGEEKFLPDSQAEPGRAVHHAVAWCTGRCGLKAGLRVEFSKLDADAGRRPRNAGTQPRFHHHFCIAWRGV